MLSGLTQTPLLAALEVVSNRNNPHIDPQLAVWEWQIPAYLFVGGLVAGLMVLIPALELRRQRPSTAPRAQWLPLWALLLVSLGMVFLFLDLSNKPNVLRFYFAFKPTSPMSWGSWILLLVTSARDRGAPQPRPPGLGRMPQRPWRRPERARAIRSRRMRFHPSCGAGNA